MSLDLSIKIKSGFTIADVATEISQLNQLVGTLGLNPEYQADWDALPDPKPATHPVEWDLFPRPIPCNPDSTSDLRFLGDINGPVDSFGRVLVRLGNYSYIDWSLLPPPSTFTVISGMPETVGIVA